MASLKAGLNEDGKSIYLPTHYVNKPGYSIEFDKNGKYDKYKMDYEALAAHIVSLHKAAVTKGVNLWRVIFDPDLQPKPITTQYGEYFKKHIQFSKKRSWVRHDAHYSYRFRYSMQGNLVLTSTSTYVVCEGPSKSQSLD